MTMKNHLNIILRPLSIAAILAIIVGAAACSKSEGASPFGFTKIYIPQSTVSGGVNLDYLVPSGLDTNTFNYQIDAKNNKVDVYLGVSRSGKQAGQAYTVTVGTRPDTISQLIADSLIKVNPHQSRPVVLLPAPAYTLPATVAVPAGQYQANFNLAIDETMLKTFAGQKVALCVVISNPTKYTLDYANSQVIVIIDVDALNLP